MSPLAGSPIEPITEPDILESIEGLPTEDDLPCDDGEPMETARHRDQMLLLIDSLRLYWQERHDFYVGGNMFLHFDPTNRRRVRGPDVFVVLNVSDRERKSWVVWQEGMRFPDIIVELLSDSTRKVDIKEKKDLYEQVFRTPEYYLYDPFSQEFRGYHLHLNDYRAVQPDERGRIASPVTGLQLGLHQGWLRWFTGDGQLVISARELAEQAQQQAEQAQQQAEQAQQQAEQAQQQAERERRRAQRLAARLRELGLDPDDGN